MTSGAEIRRWLAEPRVRGIVLAALWAGLALHGLGDVSIVGDDESREVGIVQDILAGHWLWPMFNAELIPDKPLLSHWLSALSCAIFGFSEMAVRLPSVLAAAGTIWWTVEFGSSLLGPRAGLAAGIVLATCRAFFAHARVARPDTLLVLLLALALGCTWRWWEDRSRRHATAALALLGAGVLAKGPVAPALYIMTVGLFLLWQRDLRRILDLPTLAGAAALLVLGLAWYAIGWAGWGDEFTREHLIGRYARNLLGGLTSGGTYSTKPWYHHVFFYPQHLPGVIWPWSPFAAVGLWRLWRHGGLRDPRARFLLCWVIAPIVVFTPAEWKLRYYLLPSLPPLALLTGPFLAELVDAPFLPFRVTRGSVITGAVVALVACAAGLVYLQRPDLLSESDQLTRDALLAGLGGAWEVAALIGLVAGIVAVAIACRAWGGLVVLVGVAAALWIAARRAAPRRRHQ